MVSVAIDEHSQRFRVLFRELTQLNGVRHAEFQWIHERSIRAYTETWKSTTAYSQLNRSQGDVHRRLQQFHRLRGKRANAGARQNDAGEIQRIGGENSQSL